MRLAGIKRASEADYLLATGEPPRKLLHPRIILEMAIAIIILTAPLAFSGITISTTSVSIEFRPIFPNTYTPESEPRGFVINIPEIPNITYFVFPLDGNVSEFSVAVGQFNASFIEFNPSKTSNVFFSINNEDLTIPAIERKENLWIAPSNLTIAFQLRNEFIGGA